MASTYDGTPEEREYARKTNRAKSVSLQKQLHAVEQRRRHGELYSLEKQSKELKTLIAYHDRLAK